MPLHNLTIINGTGMVPLIKTVNDNLMYGWYGNLALITIFAIFVMGFIRYTNNAKKSIGMASLFTAVFSIFFISWGIIPDETVIICWVIAGISIGINFMFPD